MGIIYLNRLQFQENENEAISIGNHESKYIKITAGILKIAFGAFAPPEVHGGFTEDLRNSKETYEV